MNIEVGFRIFPAGVLKVRDSWWRHCEMSVIMSCIWLNQFILNPKVQIAVEQGRVEVFFQSSHVMHLPLRTLFGL